MKNLSIGIDVDQVLADLHTPWINWGNAKFGTAHIEFLDWGDPGKWWGEPQDIEFLDAHIYDTDLVQPIPGAAEAVRKVRLMAKEIRFVTACPGTGDIAGAKYQWLRRHGFLHLPIEFIEAHDKSAVPVDVLADDGVHNLKTFPGIGVLVEASHNRKHVWPNRIPHIAALPAYLSSL